MPTHAGKRAVMYIPHYSLLVDQPLREWAKTFETLSGHKPTEVALPAIMLEGPTFPSDVQTMPADLAFGLHDWVSEARSMGIQKVWGIFNATFGFLEGSEDLMVTDQYGLTLDNNACIANPVVQALADQLAVDALSAGVDGVAFDLTDIYPQSGSNVTNEVQNTCFCKHCVRRFQDHDYPLEPSQFTGKKNPFRLVLKVTNTGTDNIPIRTDWLNERHADRLVTFSRARQFITPEDRSAENDASLLLENVDVRRHVVAQSVHRLGEVTRQQGKQVAVILGESNVDMSTMSDLNTLLTEKAADEFWLPEVRVEVGETNLRACRFMAARATYGVNAFFESFKEASSWLSHRGPDFLVRQAALRLRRTGGVRLTRANVFAATLSEEYEGFIGIPMQQNDFRRLTATLLLKTLSPFVPTDQLHEIVNTLTAGGMPGVTDD